MKKNNLGNLALDSVEFSSEKKSSRAQKKKTSIIEIEISTRGVGSRRRAFLVKAGVHQPLTFPRPNSSLNESAGFVNSAR